jgi:hypothetical protein
MVKVSRAPSVSCESRRRASYREPVWLSSKASKIVGREIFAELIRHRCELLGSGRREAPGAAA